MSPYADYYFDAAEAGAFLDLLANEVNIIGPEYGHADVAGTDPARLYIAVRTRTPLETPLGAMVTDPAVATALLGVWA